ncbi:hypothetical protein CBL_14024 [Carabus blaptoides fortunei]
MEREFYIADIKIYDLRRIQPISSIFNKIQLSLPRANLHECRRLCVTIQRSKDIGGGCLKFVTLPLALSTCHRATYEPSPLNPVPFYPSTRAQLTSTCGNNWLRNWRN